MERDNAERKLDILESLGEKRIPSKRPYSLDRPKSIRYRRVVDEFIKNLQKAGGDVAIISNPKQGNNIIKYYQKIKLVIDTTKGGSFELRAIKSIDLTIIEAKLGVAENGAVWIAWDDRYPRALLTLSNHLAILLPKESIVHNMFQAYSRLDFEELSYGVFLSGPSKTADIEQSLVIGAHGALSLRVFIY